MPSHKTGPNALTMAEKVQKALTLRQSGASYAEIARAMGTSTSRAHQYVTKALAEWREARIEAAEEIASTEMSRIDLIQRSIWAQALRGDLAAIDRIIKLMERRAKLLGLDAPTKVSPTDVAGSGPAEIKIVVEDVSEGWGWANGRTLEAQEVDPPG